ncbi:hypothetical protein B0A48_10191 [Cryoendolithus antarcticus]|uniref:RGS domain-containing protein n=1 Tax=Cryoendolithus antarcticus TaxID=1507870 RepID=A0A1V8SWH0_9PEZI|nr:hypothetical protein B0A48_10191 [Cryoendolithus antarcticus]
MHLNPKGRDWGAIVNFDDLGKLYTVLIVIWTAWLFTGIAWLVWNRRLPFVRIRHLPVAIISTLFLHIYLVKIMMAYTTNGHFLCSAEFWIMSVYLPLGIALFQANCTQLRSIAERQERLLARHASTDSQSPPRSLSIVGRMWARWKDLSQAHKSYVFIGVGMLVQLIMTAAIYASSPELQGDWSSYGDLPFARGQGKCRRSAAWVPSAFWQLFWTWIYGPYELYKIRHVRDTHHWRLQTILCIVAGLPGTPLWLGALFANIVFRPVNRWFVPPMWLAPGIIVMQACTIGFPIYETFEYSKAKRQHADSLQSASTMIGSVDYEEKKDFRVEDSAETLLAAIHSQFTGRTLYSKAALDFALHQMSAPLLHFAATKDFSGENIVFLTSVIRWRAAWKQVPRDTATGAIAPAARSHLFSLALQIFTESVHEKTAEFPVNIEGYIRKDLLAIFEPALAEEKRLSGESGRARRAHAAFEHGAQQNGISLRQMRAHSQLRWDTSKQAATTTRGTNGSSTDLIAPPSPDQRSASHFDSTASTPYANEQDPFSFPPHPAVAPLGEPELEVPAEFDERVFDAAEGSVKYLVLTNTWRKFIEGGKKQYDHVTSRPAV